MLGADVGALDGVLVGTDVGGAVGVMLGKDIGCDTDDVTAMIVGSNVDTDVGVGDIRDTGIADGSDTRIGSTSNDFSDNVRDTGIANGSNTGIENFCDDDILENGKSNNGNDDASDEVGDDVWIVGVDNVRDNVGDNSPNSGVDDGCDDVDDVSIEVFGGSDDVCDNDVDDACDDSDSDGICLILFSSFRRYSIPPKRPKFCPIFWSLDDSNFDVFIWPEAAVISSDFAFLSSQKDIADRSIAPAAIVVEAPSRDRTFSALQVIGSCATTIGMSPLLLEKALDRASVWAIPAVN